MDSHVPTSPTSSAPVTPSRFPVFKSWGILSLAGGLAFLGGTALWAGVRIAKASSSTPAPNQIAPGVRVAGVPVGGLTDTEATKKLRAWAKQATAKPVTLTAPVSGRKWNLPLAEVGGRFDTSSAVAEAVKLGKEETLWDRLLRGETKRTENITPAFKFSEALLDKQLAAIGKTVHRAPVNARAKIGPNGAIVLASAEKKGVSLDAQATKRALLAHGPESLREGGKANLVIVEEFPKVTSEDLGKAGFRLAEFGTYYGSSSSNRRHNIELASSHINGTVLAPGEVFSYNKIVGPRTHREGFRDAPTYQDGQVVPGPGGGVCQTSTTLYNAVLRANLEIVSRSHHSMPVHYVPPGCDATVAYDYIDFKFRNNTPGPLIVMARTNGERVSYSLFGQAPEDKKTVEVISGPRRGNASGGLTVTTYRVVRSEAGEEKREVLGTSRYRPLGSSVSSRSPRTRRAARRPSSPPSVVAPAPSLPESV
jgi:vancomycin resistance protein YoaR